MDSMNNKTHVVMSISEKVEKKENFLEALQIYERALICHPSNAVLHSNISCILLGLNRLEEASKEADIAIRLKPDWPEAYVRKAEVLSGKDDQVQALMLLCHALHLEPSNSQLLERVLDKATTIYERFPRKQMEKLEWDGEACGVLSIVGIVMLIKKHIEEAIYVLKLSLKMPEKNVKLREMVLSYLAWAHFDQSNFKKSISYYEQQLDLVKEEKQDEGIVKILDNLALAAEQENDWLLAILQRKRRINSKKLPFVEKTEEMIRVAELLIQLGRPNEALDEIGNLKIHLGKYRRILPNMANVTDTDGWLLRVQQMIQVVEGSAFASQGKTVECLELLEKFRSNDQHMMMKALENVHFCLIRQYRLNDSIGYITEIIQLAMELSNDQLNLKATILLADSYTLLGQYDEALAIAKRILSSRYRIDHSWITEIHQLLAKIYEHQKNWLGAVSVLKKLLEDTKKDTKDYVIVCLEVARLLDNIPRKEEERRKYYELAIEASNLSADSSSQALATSAFFRFLMDHGCGEEASKIKEKQKELFKTGINGTMRAIICNNLFSLGDVDAEKYLSKFNLQEEGLFDKMIILEQLAMIEMKRNNYEISKQHLLKLVELAHSQRLGLSLLKAFTQLSRLSLKLSDWDQALQWGKKALTLAFAAKDVKQMIEILSIESEAYENKQEISSAIKIVRQAMVLAEKDKLQDQQIIVYERLIHLCKIGKKEEKANQYQKKLENVMLERLKVWTESTSGKSQKALLNWISTRPFCQNRNNTLDGNKQNLFLRAFDDLKADDQLEDALYCLAEAVIYNAGGDRDEADRKLVARIDSLALSRKLQLLLLCRLKGKHSLFHLNITASIFGIKVLENNSYDIAKLLIEAYEKEDWRLVLNLLVESHHFLENQIFSNYLRQQLNVFCHWKLFSALPQDPIEEEALADLHNISWTSSLWSNCNSVLIKNRRTILQNRELCIYDDILDKVISGCMSEELEMMSMWHNEMVNYFHEKTNTDGCLKTKQYGILCPFPLSTIQHKLRMCALCYAILQPNMEEQIIILENCKRILDQHILRAYGTVSVPSVKLPILRREFFYSFSLGDLNVIWILRNGRPEIFYEEVSEELSFYSHCIKLFLIQRKISEIPKNLLSYIPDTYYITQKNINFWMRDTVLDNTKSSGLIHMMSLLSNKCISHCINGKYFSLEQLLSKMAKTKIFFIDETFGIQPDVLLASQRTPEVVVSIGDCEALIAKSLLLCGTKAILVIGKENEEKTWHMLSTSDESHLITSLCQLACLIYGSVDDFSSSELSLHRLRNILRDDISSFLIFARAMSSGGEDSEILTEITEILKELPAKQWKEFLPILQLNETEELNRIWEQADQLSSSKYEFLHRKDERRLFQLIFHDHLCLELNQGSSEDYQVFEK